MKMIEMITNANFDQHTSSRYFKEIFEKKKKIIKTIFNFDFFDMSSIF